MVSFLTYGSFRNVLFSVQISGNFPDIFLLLLSKLISLWSEDMFCKISVPLHLLRLGFGPAFGLSCCMFHVNLNMYPAVVVWNVL